MKKENAGHARRFLLCGAIGAYLERQAEPAFFRQLTDDAYRIDIGFLISRTAEFVIEGVHIVIAGAGIVFKADE